MNHKTIRSEHNKLFHVISALYLEVIEGKVSHVEAKKRLKEIDKKLAKIKKGICKAK